jgi:methylglutaconyl-CoA hydratase
VHAVVDGMELDERVGQYVREVLTSGPQAIAAAKTLLRDIDGVSVDEASVITSETLARRRTSDEGREGLSAFLEKRRPAWSDPH